MSSIKERIIGAVSVMKEEDAEKVWNLILSAFSLQDIDSVEPDEEELDVIHKYLAKDTEYQPVCTHDELRKELGL